MNKKIGLVLLFALLFSMGSKAQQATSMRINEVLVINEDNFVDDYGKRHGWIELYNSSAGTVNIAGCFLTNDKNNPRKYPIPKGDVNTQIPPGQQVLFWADDEPHRGTFHISFKLDPDKENYIALYNAAIAYEPEKNIPFGAFAKVCLRNRILSYIRYFHENQTSESLDDVDAEPDIPVSETPEQLMINKESLTELHHRIDRMLTDFEKSVFALYVGSMSYMDIAKALSKPKKSIDNAIHRIKAKLRKLL